MGRTQDHLQFGRRDLEPLLWLAGLLSGIRSQLFSAQSPPLSVGIVSCPPRSRRGSRGPAPGEAHHLSVKPLLTSLRPTLWGWGALTATAPVYSTGILWRTGRKDVNVKSQGWSRKCRERRCSSSSPHRGRSRSPSRWLPLYPPKLSSRSFCHCLPVETCTETTVES